MKRRYFVVHFMADMPVEGGDDEMGYSTDPSNGKIYVTTGGRYPSEARLVELIQDQNPTLSKIYVDRVVEMNRQDYEEFIEGHPGRITTEMLDPNAGRNFI